MAHVRESSAVKTPNAPTPQTTRGNVCVTRDTKAMVKPVLVSTCDSCIGTKLASDLTVYLLSSIERYLFQARKSFKFL